MIESESGAPIRVERRGPVTTVILDRPGAKNAVDRDTAAALADAFRAFDAVAGGLELALWCDLRVAEDTAILGVFCRRFGVPLIDGGTIRLPRLIGLSRALDLILAGRAVAADEALSLGLVTRVVPHGHA